MRRVALFTSLSTVLVLISCNLHKQEKVEVQDYPTTNPVVLDTVLIKDYVSQVKSIKNIEIRAQERGYLEKILVDEGEYVKEGQLLFRIKSQIYRAEVAKTEAEVKQAQIELQNVETLATNNVVSNNEKEVAIAQLDAAKSELKLANIHLSQTEIRAPFSGVIDRIPKKLGSLINEGDLLTTLSDNSSMYVYFNVSESEYLNYEEQLETEEGMSVDLALVNNQMFGSKGKVENIEGEFNSETGNIAFRAKFPNPNKLLRHGETGKVRLTIPIDKALIIPQKATYEIQDKKYVFVVDSKGIVHSRNIEVSNNSLPDLYIVVKGLDIKDQILLEGIQRVKEGDEVKAKFIGPIKVIDSLKLKAD